MNAQENRLKSFALAAAVLILTAAAMIFSGGCGGGSSSSSAKKLYTIGDIDSATVAKLNKADIEVVEFNPTMTSKVKDGSSFIMQEQGIQLVSADETGAGLAAMLARCYSTGGEIVLLSSDKTERDYLTDKVLASYDIEDASEGVLKLFAVTQETNGNTRTFIGEGGSGVEVSTDIYWHAVKSGDEFYIYSQENDESDLIGDGIKNILFVTEAKTVSLDIQDENGNIIQSPYTTSVNYMVASGDTLRVSCDMVESGDVAWQMVGDRITSYDNTEEIASQDVKAEDDSDKETWESLYDWLSYEESESAAANQKAASVLAKAGLNAASNSDQKTDITDLIKTDSKLVEGYLNGKHYTVNVYVMPVHSFKDNTDWYAVRQECGFLGGNRL